MFVAMENTIFVLKINHIAICMCNILTCWSKATSTSCLGGWPPSFNLLCANAQGTLDSANIVLCVCSACVYWVMGDDPKLLNNKREVPKLNIVVNGSIPGYEIVSLRYRKLGRWSSASCVLKKKKKAFVC